MGFRFKASVLGRVGVACLVGGVCVFSGTPLSPGVLDQPLKSDVCRRKERRVSERAKQGAEIEERRQRRTSVCFHIRNILLQYDPGPVDSSSLPHSLTHKFQGKSASRF